jgi:HEAT repeat protein
MISKSRGGSNDPRELSRRIKLDTDVACAGKASMIKRVVVGFVVGLALCFGLVMSVPYTRIGFFGWVRHERFAQGWPASHWIENLLDHPDKDVQRQAADALVEIGPSVVPDVVAGIKSRKDPLPRPAVDVFVRIGEPAVRPLTAELPSDDEIFRRKAMRILLRMGPAAREALPVLIEGLSHTDARYRQGSARILARIGPDARIAVEALGKALADGDEGVRKEAAAALGSIGRPDAVRVLPQLIKRLRDSNAQVRRQVAQAIGVLGPEAHPAVNSLQTALGDEDALVRKYAARALGVVGLSAAPAVKKLTALVDSDASLEVRREAATALGQIGPDARPSLPALVKAVFSEYLDLSEPAAEALVKIQGDGQLTLALWKRHMENREKRFDLIVLDRTQTLIRRNVLNQGQLLPVLGEMARRTGPSQRRVRMRAALLLVELAPWSPEAADGLGEACLEPVFRERAFLALVKLQEPGARPLSLLLKEKDKSLRREAASSLGQIGQAAHAAIPALVARLLDREPEVVKEAREALAKIAPQTFEWVGGLKGKVGSIWNKATRCRAAYELSLNGANVDQAVPELSAAIKDPDPEIRLVAAYTLGCTTGFGRPLLPDLAVLVKDPNPELRMVAAHTVGRLFFSQEGASTLIPLLKDQDVDVRWQALQGLGRLGWWAGEAIPDLVDLLKHRERDLRLAAARVFAGMGPSAKKALPALIKALHDSDPGVRHQVAWDLGNLGPEASLAVSDLIKASRDKHMMTRWAAVWALARLGPAAEKKAIAALQKALKDEDPGVRGEAASGLGAKGAAAASATRDLAHLLQDTNIHVRLAAAEALWRVDRRRIKEVLPVLRTELRNKQPGFSGRRQAAAIVGRMGMDASELVPDLLDALKDPNDFTRDQLAQVVTALGSMRPAKGDLEVKVTGALVNALMSDSNLFVRGAAANTLSQYGPGDKDAVETLRGALARQDPYGQRPVIVTALGKIGPAAAPAVGGLIVLLGDGNAAVSGTAATALGQIGPAAKAALSQLVAHLSVPFPDIRSQAALAMAQIDPTGNESLSKLLPLLNQNGPARLGAVLALGHLGPAAARAITPLLGLLKEPDQNLRWQILAALQRIDPTGKQVVPGLLASLQDQNEAVREQTIRVLGQYGPAARKAAAQLALALKDTASSVRLAAAESLWLIDRNADGVPILIAGLKDGNVNVVRRCCLALNPMGPAARQAVPALVPLLKSPTLFLRHTAAYTLSRIGPGAREAVNALIECLTGTDTSLKHQAANALGQVGPAAEKAVPALRELLTNVDIPVSAAAAQALGKIGPKARQAISDLEHALDASAPDVRIEAALALWRIDRDPKKVFPVLLAALKDPVQGIRQQAAIKLGEIGRPAKDTAPALKKAIRDSKHIMEQMILAEALWKVSGEVDGLLPVFHAACKDPLPTIRELAARKLGQMGPAAKKTLADLQKLAKDPTESVRREALQALAKCRPDADGEAKD